MLSDGCIKFHSPSSGDQIYLDPVAMAVKNNRWQSSPQCAAHAETFRNCFLASRYTFDKTDLTMDTCLVDLLANIGQTHSSEVLAAGPDAAAAGGQQSKGTTSDCTQNDLAMEAGSGKRTRDEDEEIDTQLDGKGKRPAL